MIKGYTFLFLFCFCFDWGTLWSIGHGTPLDLMFYDLTYHRRCSIAFRAWHKSNHQAHLSPGNGNGWLSNRACAASNERELGSRLWTVWGLGSTQHCRKLSRMIRETLGWHPELSQLPLQTVSRHLLHHTYAILSLRLGPIIDGLPRGSQDAIVQPSVEGGTW